jgi:patatin-like phospholipase/acyl hydrolase
MALRILAIDGGGIRGYFAVHVLERIQQEHGVRFAHTFDLICGTSTGAIIAAALATEYPLENVKKLYEDRGSHIFQRATGSIGGLLRAKYDIARLRSELLEVFGDRMLTQTVARLLIPATDIGNGQVHVFKSAYSGDFVRDKNVRIADAVLASCAAPTYFAPAYVDPYLLADGGLWANNPALVGYVEAITRLGASPSDVRLLSIGAGAGEKYYRIGDSGRQWGVMTGWGVAGLIDVILNLQSKNADNMLGLLLPDTQYLRINFSRDHKLSLDDVESLPELRSIADRLFTENTAAIRKLLDIEGASK